jgi:hypothetical protein
MLYFYEVSSRNEIFVLSHFSKLERHLGFSADVQKKVIACGKWVGNHPKENLVGWSEPAATNALVQDEAVRAVLGMNQKHILFPCPGIFQSPSLP